MAISSERRDPETESTSCNVFPLPRNLHLNIHGIYRRKSEQFERLPWLPSKLIWSCIDYRGMYLSLDGSLVVAKTPVLRDLQKVAEAGREAATNGLLVHGLGSSKVGLSSVSFWLETSWRAKRELHRRKMGAGHLMAGSL